MAALPQYQNVLISSIGNKVGLLQSWQQTLRKINGQLIGLDSSANPSAAELCDTFIQTPETLNAKFWTLVEETIKKHSIKVVIPTRNEELLAWATQKKNHPEFFDSTFLSLSSFECIQICTDKRKLHTWLKNEGFPTVDFVEIGSLSPRDPLPEPLEFPCIAKDPLTSSSRKVKTLNFKYQVFELPKHWILQPLLTGNEYTLNAYINQQGVCVCVVPHIRERMLDGQITQATTIRQDVLSNLGKKVAEALPGARGAINLQVFWNPGSNEEPLIIDINPCFGGGYPLTHRAGGRFTDWMLLEANNQPTPKNFHSWEEGIQFQRMGDTPFFTRSHAPFEAATSHQR